MAEAVWAIELDHLPLVVGIDSHGNDIFDAARKNAEKAFGRTPHCSAGAGSDVQSTAFFRLACLECRRT